MKRRGTRAQFQDHTNNAFANGAPVPGQFYGGFGFQQQMPPNQAQFYTGGYFGQGFGGGPSGNGLYAGFPTLQTPPAAPLQPAAAPPPSPPQMLYQVDNSGALDLLGSMYPTIPDWLSNCAAMRTCANKGINFASLSQLFASHGFHSLEQIDGKFITAMQLHDWLNIDLGTGILILQYAKADLDAINAHALQYDSIPASGGTTEGSNMDYHPEMTIGGETR
jgi:hypothetical protein